MTDRRQERVLGWGLFIVGLVVVLDQGGLLLENVIPFNLASPQWRFASLGSASLRYTPLLFADIFLLLSAFYLDARGWLRTLGVVHIILAIVMGAVVLLFGLDAIEMRRQVRLELVRGLTAGAMRVAAMTGLLALFSLWIGVRLVRATRGTTSRTKQDTRRPLVVGSTGDSVVDRE